MQQGIDWPGGMDWLGKGQMTGIHSGQRGPIRQGFGMIRLENSSSDCPMGMSFRGNSVNSAYTRESGVSIDSFGCCNRSSTINGREVKSYSLDSFVANLGR